MLPFYGGITLLLGGEKCETLRRKLFAVSGLVALLRWDKSCRGWRCAAWMSNDSHGRGDGGDEWKKK